MDTPLPPALAPNGRPSRGGRRTRGADQTSVRRANLAVVLGHVAEHGPVSRAAVASATGLTKATVSSLVAELLDRGLLREAGRPERAGRVGRPGLALALADTTVAVGLEVNVDYLALCAEDLSGRVRLEQRVPGDNRGASVGPVLDRLAALARVALDDAGRNGCVVAGIGVAVPGLVDLDSGTLLRAPNLGWADVPLAAELGRRLDVDVPLRVENEANLAALAEHWGGSASDLQDFVAVFGEVGVGAGIFVRGALYRGSRGFGGEIGHTTVDPHGQACACGSSGCLETVAGLEAIARRAGVEGGPSRGATDELVRRASAGDARTLDSLREAGAALGLALASTANLFDPEAVILGGCFGPLAPWLRDGVEAALAGRVLSARWSTPDVRATELGEPAAVRGAAALTLRGVLEAPWTIPSAAERGASEEGGEREAVPRAATV